MTMSTPRCRRKTILAATASVLILAFSSSDLQAAVQTRGRVRNNGTTIVTDWGTRLRMACWGMDICRCLFEREELRDLKNCGLNGIHVYLELTTTNAPEPIGYNAERMDSLVSWCRQESLYVVITHGGPIDNSTVEKCAKVWEFYAPRYADETHVVYEIKNEPNLKAIDVNRECFKVIRQYAPETHVLCLSYSNIRSGASRITNAIDELGDAIDWSNASVAYHGYGTSGEFQEDAIKTINDYGYAVTCTEFWPANHLELNYERAGISYAHFQWCAIIYGRGIEATCDRIKGIAFDYEPDFGNWPKPHIDPPVQATWQPWLKQGRACAPISRRVVFGGMPKGDVRAIYDLTGRALWQQEGSNGLAGGARREAAIRRKGPAGLIVEYAR
jgi:hypothetical protein